MVITRLTPAGLRTLVPQPKKGPEFRAVSEVIHIGHGAGLSRVALMTE
jgi:hypothetical protein